MTKARIYRQWLRQRRLVGTTEDFTQKVMERISAHRPDFEVPLPPPAPAPDAWPEGLARLAAAGGLVGLGLFRLAYVGLSLVMP